MQEDDSRIATREKERKWKRPRLDDPEELKLVYDIYMDPSHPLLGDEGRDRMQRRLTRERQKKISSR